MTWFALCLLAAASFVCPLDRILPPRVVGAQVRRVRPDPHPAQIEPVCIPAGHHGDIRPCEPKLVIPDRLVQQSEIGVGQVQNGPAKGFGYFGAMLQCVERRTERSFISPEVSN
jgi:hypothetical protein